MSSDDRRTLRRRVKLLSDEQRALALAGLTDDNNSTRALDQTSIYTFTIPRRNDVIYMAAPDLQTVHKAFAGIYSVDMKAAKFVPTDELPHLYEWSRMNGTVIPDLSNGHFVRIRRRGLFEQGELADYAGDLAFVADIQINVEDRNRDLVLISLFPRLHYKGDDASAVGMFPVFTELRERAVQTREVLAPHEYLSGKSIPLITSVSGCLANATTCHDAAVQTDSGLESNHDVGVQTYDMTSLDSVLSAICDRPHPVNASSQCEPLSGLNTCIGTGSLATKLDASVQASFTVVDLVSKPTHRRPRLPQRMFVPEFLERQHPGQMQETSSGRIIYQGQTYFDGMLLITLSGYDSVIRSWPTPEMAWMFLAERLGSALVVNMAYLRVGDQVGMFEARDIQMRASRPEMLGIVKDIGYPNVTVEVEGLPGPVHHRIDKMWRIIREGTWVEDMIVKKGRIGIVVDSYADDSIDVCYWDDDNKIQHYSSYAWCFRTADPPSAMLKPVPEMRALRKPLVPKLEPLGDQMRRLYRNSFIGKDAYVFDGDLKGRIGRVLGIGDHSATLVFDGQLIKYHINLTVAVNVYVSAGSSPRICNSLQLFQKHATAS